MECQCKFWNWLQPQQQRRAGASAVPLQWPPDRIATLNLDMFDEILKALSAVDCSQCGSECSNHRLEQKTSKTQQRHRCVASLQQHWCRVSCTARLAALPANTSTHASDDAVGLLNVGHG